MRGTRLTRSCIVFIRDDTPCRSVNRLKLRFMRKAGIGREMYAKMLAKIVACNFAELRVESPPLQNLLCFFRLFKGGESLALHRTAYDLSKVFRGPVQS